MYKFKDARIQRQKGKRHKTQIQKTKDKVSILKSHDTWVNQWQHEHWFPGSWRRSQRASWSESPSSHSSPPALEPDHNHRYHNHFILFEITIILFETIFPTWLCMSLMMNVVGRLLACSSLSFWSSSSWGWHWPQWSILKHLARHCPRALASYKPV